MILLSIVATIGILIPAQDSVLEGNRPLITNKEDAASIATVYLSRVYGAKNIKKQKPFIVKLQGNLWIIEGRFPNKSSGFKNGTLTVAFGGVASIAIDKFNGKVVRITHSE